MDEPQKKKETEQQQAPEPQPQPAADMEERLAAAERDRDEYLAGWQRTKADFINYKKEETKKLEDIARYGSVDLVKDLISVLDNFDLALRTFEKEGPVEKGLYLIRTQLEDILKKRGLEKMSVKPGDVFDPAIAEALTEVESEHHPAGTVVEEIEPGYRMYDKILRPARVIVSKDKDHA